MRVSIMSLSLVLLLFYSGLAWAGDPAAADALFQNAVPKLEAGQFDAACPMLEESYRLDPKTGTLFTLAECHAQWGKIASALVEHRRYMRLVDEMAPEKRGKHEARYEQSKTRVTEIEPQVPELWLGLPVDAPAGTKVFRNGQEVSPPSMGLSLPVDPGEHEIVLEVPGQAPEKRVVKVDKGAKVKVELTLPPKNAAPSGTIVAAPEKTGNGSKSSGMKAGAFVVGGIGLAGLALGAITGGMAMSKVPVIEEHCPDKKCRNQEGKTAVQSGQTLALVSTIGFGVGIAGLATGTILMLASRKPVEKPRPSGVQALFVPVDSSGMMVGVRGAF